MKEKYRIFLFIKKGKRKDEILSCWEDVTRSIISGVIITKEKEKFAI